MESILAFLPEEHRVQVLGDDGPVAVLHGRNRSEDTRSSRSPKKRAQARAAYALKLLQIGRRADDRVDRQGPGTRAG